MAAEYDKTWENNFTLRPRAEFDARESEELDFLQNELSRVQLKHKASLNQYNDLYTHCGTIVRQLEEQRAAGENLRSENESLKKEIQTLHVAQLANAEEMKSVSESNLEREQELRSLRTSASNGRIGNERIRRFLPDTITTLRDLCSFIENLMEKLESPQSPDALAPKAGKIMVEQLKVEIESLRGLHALLLSGERQ